MRPWRRRSLGTLVLAAATATVLALSGCGAVASKDQTHLKIAGIFPASHIASTAGVDVFTEELANGPGKPIDAEYWPSGQLGTVGDLTSLTRTGALDIVSVLPPNQSDIVPLAGVSDLPGFDPDTCVTSLALMRLLKPGGIIYEDEFEPLGLIPLWVGSVTKYEIWTANKQVRTPEDLRGMSIRSGGGVMDSTVSALGGSPVAIPSSDVFESLQRHTIDGAAFPASSIGTYSLQDVVKYATKGIGVGSGSWIFSMSADAFNDLEPEQQENIRAAADKTGRAQCEGIRADDKAAEKTLAESDVEFTELTDAESKAFSKNMPEIQQKWADGLDAIGKPGSETLQAYAEAVKAQEKEEGL